MALSIAPSTFPCVAAPFHADTGIEKTRRNETGWRTAPWEPTREFWTENQWLKIWLAPKHTGDD